MLFEDQQRHQRKNAALAIVVDTHGKDNVFHRCDDDQRPYDQRQHAKHDLGCGRADTHAEHGLERVQRAAADIAKDDPKGGQAHCSEAGPGNREGGIGAHRDAGFLAHESKGSLPSSVPYVLNLL